MPSQIMQQVGAQKDARNSAYLQDDMDRWQANSMQPWERLGLAANLFTGVGGKGASATQNTYARNTTSPFVSGLGGALSGASLGGMLGGASMGSTFGPIGAGIGGLLGFMR